MESRQSIEALLERGTWLRKLAIELVGDPAEADDLVQETWVRALRRPPRAGTSATAWLAVVLRNVARQRWRSARSRSDREALRASERDSQADSAAEVVARAQAQRRLVEAVLELDERSRVVLLMRYFDDLDPGAIAREIGVPPSTVRSRLARGLEALRLRLRARYGETFHSWLAVLGAGAARLGEAHQAVPTVSGASTPRIASLLGVRMVVAVLALGTAAVGIRLTWSSISAAGDEDSPLMANAGVASVGPAGVLPTRSFPTPELAAALPAIDPGGVERVAPEPRPRSVAGASDLLVEDVEAPPEPERTVVAVCVDGEPTEHGEVTLHCGGGGGRELRARISGGRASFPREWVKSVSIELSPFGPLDYRLAGAAPDEILIDLGTARIEGTVWSADGQPAEGARVSVSSHGTLGAERVTDAAGWFSVGDLPEGEFFIAASPPGGGDLLVSGALARGEVREVLLGSPAGLVQLAGKVTAADGSPLLPVTFRSCGRLHFRGLDGEAPLHLDANVDMAGRYEAALVAGSYEVFLMAHGGPGSAGLAAARLGVVRAEGDATHDFALPGARIEGRALNARRGRPFDPRSDGRARLTLEPLWAGGAALEPCEVEVLPEGRFVIQGVPEGEWRLVGQRVQPAEGVPVSIHGDGVVEIEVHLR